MALEEFKIILSGIETAICKKNSFNNNVNELDHNFFSFYYDNTHYCHIKINQDTTTTEWVGVSKPTFENAYKTYSNLEDWIESCTTYNKEMFL